MTAEQGQALWQAPDCGQMKGKRDRALLALLLACGLRRHELAVLTVGHLQQREGHWAIVDLRGKAGHIRTIPVPDWVTDLLNDCGTPTGPPSKADEALKKIDEVIHTIVRESLKKEDPPRRPRGRC